MSKAFGEHLKELRMSKEYTQAELAKLLGIERSTLTKYETGKSEPNMSTLKSLCKALGVDYNTLLNDQNPRT